jgi:hypothetical protein
LKEFTAYIKRDAPKLHKALTDGVYVLVLTQKPAPNRVLAFEKKADKGYHTVVMGDNAVKVFTTKELKKALKKSD